MASQDYEAQIAAFIKAKGITRCPTACAAPTHASGSERDRAALRQRDERRESARQEKADQEKFRQAWARMVIAA